jgi:hypothetical protein
MAGGVLVNNGPIRQTPAGGAPSYYLPGSTVKNPQYAQQKTAYDQNQEATRLATEADARERANFASNAMNSATTGLAGQTTRVSPTGSQYSYSFDGGGTGSGAGSRATTSGNPFDLWSEFAKAQANVPQVSSPRASLSDADNAAAEAAAFGRAKDRTGLATQGLLRSIRNQMARRGISGSGIEADMTGDALMGGFGEIGEVIRDQAIEGLQRRYDMADQTYQGEITQRGQDMSAAAQRNDMIMSLLRLAESGRY